MTIKEQYERDGVAWPVDLLSMSETAELQASFWEADAKYDLMKSDYRCKAQALFPWVAKLARHPKVVDALLPILGEFHCWDTLFWIKHPYDQKYVSRHQDSTYWNFQPKRLGLTVWVAVTDITANNGGVHYVVQDYDKHRERHISHKDVKNPKNLLMRGQTAEGNEPTILVELKAGQCAIHSGFVVHESYANHTDKPRAAIGMVFASNEVKPIAKYAPESTLPVVGTPSNFILEVTPTGDFDYDLPSWRDAYDRQHENYYKMQQDAS